MRLGILYSRMRKEEKRLFAEAEKLGVEVVSMVDEELIFDAQGNTQIDLEGVDVILNRSIAHVREEISIKMLEANGLRVVNSYQIAVTCNNKILTDIVLAKAGVPIPLSRVAYSQESALEAIEQLGYPVVLKPMLGSWGRLISKVNDREAAEALLEHKLVLGSIQHSVFYVQEYINKNTELRTQNSARNRDIRAFVIGGEVVGAIYRNSEHWITNTARGGEATNCPVDDELREICLRAAQAVGGGLLAMDILESMDGYLVCEVNHTMEFRNSEEPIGVNIAGRMIQYCIDVCSRNT